MNYLKHLQLIVLFAMLCSGLQAQLGGEVENLANRFQTAFNNENEAEIGRLLSTKATLVDPNGATTRGTSRIVNNLDGKFNNTNLEANIKITNITLQGATKATIFAVYEMDSTLKLNAQNIPFEESYLKISADKGDGTWKITNIRHLSKIKTIFTSSASQGFSSWNSEYSALSELRKAKGELSFEAGNLVDNLNTAIVVNEWVALDSFTNFMASRDFNKITNDTKPETFILKIKDKNASADGNVTSLIMHKVQDFNSWRKVFESLAEFRKSAGELSYEIGVFRSDATMVYVLNEWNSIEDFNKFLASETLKNGMEKGGVLEAPKVMTFTIKDKN